MQFAFRVDASLEMGTGHVMRCLALADALKAEGAQCHFVCREHHGHLMVRIEAQGHKVYSLPQPVSVGRSEINTGSFPAYAAWLGCNWETDAAQTLASLEGLNLNWLVVDHYALDSRWEKSMRQMAPKIMVIDDLADRMHDCDLLLDQTFARSKDAYRFWVPEYCALLTGSKYALLRPEFAALRDYSLKRRAQQSKLEHLLISMGGSDNDNATGKVLEALQESPLPKGCHITVVMGSSAPWLDSIGEKAEKLAWPVEVKVNVNNMAQLMADSDLAIGAAGSTSWERCCLGLPALILVLADNQNYISTELEKAGAAILISKNKTISKYLLKVSIEKCSNKKQLELMTEHSSLVCDGRGVKKVMEMLSNQGKTCM